jgi:hypothetical protein
MKKIIILFSLSLIFLTSCNFDSEIDDLRTIKFKDKALNQIEDSLNNVEIARLTSELSDANKKIKELTKEPQTLEELKQKKIALTLMIIENKKELSSITTLKDLMTEVQNKEWLLKIYDANSNLITTKKLYSDFKNSEEYNNSKESIKIANIYLRYLRTAREKYYRINDRFTSYKKKRELLFLKKKTNIIISNFNLKNQLIVVDNKIKMLSKTVIN